MWHCLTARHWAFVPPACLWYDGAPHVWPLTTARTMNETMANNGLPKRTIAVGRQLVAAIPTPLLDSKLFVCTRFVHCLFAWSICVVFCVPSWLWCCSTGRHCASCHGVVGVRFCTTCVPVDDGTNERIVGNQWPGERTRAVMPRLMAAVATPLPHSKLFVCRPLVHCWFASLMCVVCCLRCGVAPRGVIVCLAAA